MLKPASPQTPVFGTTTLTTQCLSISIHHLRREKYEEKEIKRFTMKKAEENISIYLSYFISDFLVFFIIRGCLHDSGATFAPERVHSGSLSWLYICLHDTTTKCHAGASHPGVSSPRLLYRGENFTPVRNLATVSCKRETTTRFGVKSVCR